MSGDPSINRVYFKKYLCQEKIGKGSFGMVYSGINTTTKDKIAFKIEKREENKGGTLEMETYRLICLQGEGIPKVLCYGKNQTHYILIQELLGSNLEELFVSCGQMFSLKTVCVLGIQMLERIQFVHSNHHIHRDIKPENFMFGRYENEEKLYLIDFGLSKKYFSTSKSEHIKFCTGKYLTGTARYCARNAHKGYEQSRRDDLESIGYVLVYLLQGTLPWQGLKLKPGEDHFEKIAEKKENTSFSKLCQGQPSELVQWFKYVDGLAFDEAPDYGFLIGLFKEIITKHCSNSLYNFDWKKVARNRLSVDKEKKSRNVSILVHNVNGLSTLNESRNMPNEEMGMNEYKEGHSKQKGNKEEINDTDSPDFNASPIISGRKSKKKESNEEPIDQLKHIEGEVSRKRNNSHIQLNKTHKSKGDIWKGMLPLFKPKILSSIRKSSQPLSSETEKNFGLLMRELSEKKRSDECKAKEEGMKAVEVNHNSVSEHDNDNTKVNQRNSIASSENKNEKSKNVNEFNQKDLTKCTCILI